MSMYDCHSDNKGQAPRKSSYMAQDGWEQVDVPSNVLGFLPQSIIQPKMVEIETDWETEIVAPDGTVANCGQIESHRDADCDGCSEQRTRRLKPAMIEIDLSSTLGMCERLDG